ncbi:MAG: DUF4845 domain-containing protein [Betaproteobacteria bacterium]|nr:DUF4845 domain-containing protein [Betaproteobacteria bacterium]
MKALKYQRGVSLADLVAWGFVIIFCVFITVKVLPSLSDFWKIRTAAAATASKVQPSDSASTIRRVFDDHITIEGTKRIYNSDFNFEVRKEGSTGTVIFFEYSDKIPLFTNVSLLMEYQNKQPIGSTRRTSSQE